MHRFGWGSVVLLTVCRYNLKMLVGGVSFIHPPEQHLCFRLMINPFYLERQMDSQDHVISHIHLGFKLCTYCWAHSGPTTGVEPICVLWGTYWQLQPLAARCDDQSEKLLFVRKNLLYQNWKVCSLAWNKSKGTEVFSQLSFRSSDNWLLLPRWFSAKKKTKKKKPFGVSGWSPLVCQRKTFVDCWTYHILRHTPEKLCILGNSLHSTISLERVHHRFYFS